MYDPLHSLLSGSIRYLLSWVKGGKINNESGSQPFLSPKCLLVLLVLNSVLAVSIKTFNNTADTSFMG